MKYLHMINKNSKTLKNYNVLGVIKSLIQT